ncbi:MAG: glutathione peroxidase [Pseudomonadota bacterium]
MKLNVWLPAFALVLLATAALAGEKGVSAHDFAFTTIEETGQHELASHKGKVVLVVNTASFCGFTPQYTGLEDLWRTYKDQGLVVLGVPSNDFGAQEPKSNLEVKQFCQGAYNVTFPLAAKTKVRGKQAHAFYRWLDKTTDGEGSPRWNFHKVLIGKDGSLESWFASNKTPGSSQVRGAIEAALGKSAPAG